MTHASRGALSALLLLALSAPALGDDSVLCLGPGLEKVLDGLAQAHAFDGVVAPGYRLERLDVKSDHLELGYDDDAGPAVTVVLGAPIVDDGGDARGPHFSHRVVEQRGHASAAARAAMLGAAMLVDSAVPASEVRRCGGPRTPGSDGSSMPARAPAAFGLGVGIAEALIVLAALALGLRGPRRGRRGPRGPA